MLRRIRPYLTAGWAAYTVLTVAVSVAMVQLGRWQLHVSDRKHFDVQNFGYAIQWWAFTAFTLAFWVRTVRDRGRSSSAELVVTGGRVVVPVARDGGEADGHIGAAYLTSAPTKAGEPGVVYRGYVMPQMADNSVHPNDAAYASYNDYLWQIAMADSAEGHTMPVPNIPGVGPVTEEKQADEPVRRQLPDAPA